MSDLVIPPGYGQATLQFSVEGRINPYSVSIGFAKKDDDQPLSDCINGIYQSFTDDDSICGHGAMASQFTCIGASCVYNLEGVMVGAASDLPATHGSLTVTDPMIVNSTWIIRKRTGLIGRQYRGRMYLPYMWGGEASIDYLGTILGTDLAAFGVKLDAFSASVFEGTPDWIPNLLHHAPKEGATPVPTPIVSFSLESVVGTQRRRLR